MKIRTRILSIFILFMPTLSFSQVGFLWERVPDTSSTDSLNFTNNQYDCPLFTEHWKVFDKQKLMGEKTEIVTHTKIVKDFNNDGFCDFFVAFAYPYKEAEEDALPYEKSFIPYLLKLYNPESREFEDASHLIENNKGQPLSRHAVAGDFNKDGVLDIAIAGHPTRNGVDSSYVDIVLSNNQGWEQINVLAVDVNCFGCTGDEYNTFNYGYFHSLALGDVNNDDLIDIVVSNFNHNFGNITLLNLGNGGFEKFYSMKSQSKESFNNDLYDLNGDGCLDLLTDSPNSSAIGKIFYGDCDGFFGETETELVINSNPELSWEMFQRFVISDLNNDGLQDIVASVTVDSYNDFRLVFFINKGIVNGRVQLDEISERINKDLIEQDFYKDYHSINNWPEILSVADINNDGFKDILWRDFFDTRGSYLSKFNYESATPFLFGEPDGTYSYAKYPLTKPIKNFGIEKKQDSLFINFQIEYLKDTSFHNTTNSRELRGAIVDWVIYFNDEPFTYKNSQGTGRVIADLIKEEQLQTSWYYRYIIATNAKLPKSTFIRIAYIDKYGVEFPLTNQITGPLYNLPETISFDELILGDEQVKTLTLENTGDGTLNIEEITMPEGYTIDQSTISVAAGASADLSITFTPTEGKSYEGLMTITSNNGVEEINLIGTGLLVTNIDDAYLDAEEVKAYPNPTSDVLNIDLSNSPVAVANLRLVDMEGSLFWQRKEVREKQLTINVSNYQSGTYLLLIETSKGRLVKKIIINK